MAWQEFIREDSYVSKDSPNITITSDGKFMFNVKFVNEARVTRKQRVIFHIDEPTRRIGFEFITDDRPNSFALGSRTQGSAPSGFNCAGLGVINRYPWIRAVASLKSAQAKKFIPKQDRESGKGIWIIQLCPAFENSEPREGNDIPSGVKGIYRYRRGKDGEIVYIGKGDIKTRLNESQRDEWKFDTVEYSVVIDADARTKWEDFWITRFQEEKDGKLPMYNKVAASS